MNIENFTKIPNDLIEILLSSALNNSQRRILIFVARKTYGFNKETDRISWSQFQNKLNISRGTLSSSFNKLKLVHLLILANKGNSKKSSNEWQINLLNYQEKLVQLTKLVQSDPKKLVLKSSDTKESITKGIKHLSSKKKVGWTLEALKALEELGGVNL
jgi:phage replication O-like protein O